MSLPIVLWRIDTVLVAPSRARDTREVKALEATGRARRVCPQRDRGNVKRWTDENGDRHLAVHHRRRPGVRVGGRTYRSPIHVHQPTDEGMGFIRGALAHGRLAVLRLDLACDLACPSQAAADELHLRLRARVLLTGGGGGRLRVARSTSTSPGSTYVGATKDEESRQQGEGAVLVVYSDRHASRKNHDRPTVHVELRLFGSRAVRRAVGRGLDVELAWERVRVLPDLGPIGSYLRREASKGAATLYAQNVIHEMRLLGLDRRRMFARAVPFTDWTAHRKFAPSVPTSNPGTQGLVGRSSAVAASAPIPQRVGHPESGPVSSAPRPRFRFPQVTKKPRPTVRDRPRRLSRFLARGLRLPGFPARFIRGWRRNLARFMARFRSYDTDQERHFYGLSKVGRSRPVFARLRDLGTSPARIQRVRTPFS